MYMENHFDKRLDPTKLVDDGKIIYSVVKLLPWKHSNFNTLKFQNMLMIIIK
jgi:hypothetical protein